MTKTVFDFLDLEDQEILSVIKEQAQNLTEKEKQTKIVSQILEKKVRDFYYNKLKEEINQEDYSSLKKYIDKKFPKRKKDKKELLSSVSTFILFLKQIGIEPNVDFYQMLLEENNALKKSLEKILPEERVSYQKLETIAKEPMLFQILEAYCVTTNKICDDEIEEEEDIFKLIDQTIDIPDEILNDSVKMFFTEVRRIQPLSVYEQNEIFATYQVGDKEKEDLLLKSNLRLVISTARHYIGRGILFLDLIQEGSLGLLKAIQRYDITKGSAFSTYARCWIRQAMIRAIYDKAKPVRLPSYIEGELYQYEQKKREYITLYQKEPTKEDMASFLNIPYKKIEQYEYFRDNPVISMNTTVYSEKDNRDLILGDIISDPQQVPISEIILEEDMCEHIRNFLFQAKCINEKEKFVLAHRYGFIGEEKTLKETAELLYQLGYNDTIITHQAVSAIQQKALKKLRRANKQKIRDYALEEPKGKVYQKSVKESKK